MDQSAKATWIEALRSGEFKQGTGRLYDAEDNTYCCLGVLQCVFPWLKRHPSSDLLDDSALKQLDMTSEQQTELAEMNDNSYTFEEIAKHIEENL